MPKEKDILCRAMEDVEFAEAIRSDPERALQGYDLSGELLEAIKNGDEEHIRSVLELEYSSGVLNH